MDYKALIERMILTECESYCAGWYTEYELQIFESNKPNIEFEIIGVFHTPLKGNENIRMVGNVTNYGVTVWYSEQI